MSTRDMTPEQAYTRGLELIDKGEATELADIVRELIAFAPTNIQYQELYVDAILARYKSGQIAPDDALTTLSSTLRFGRFIGKLAPAYFKELEGLLVQLPRLSKPGQLIIGLGPGRNGSTTLASILSTIPEAGITHEMYPTLFVAPTSEQLAFHKQRFELLLQYNPYVADVSHWWLYATSWLQQCFPTVKFVTLRRDTEQVVRSFERVKNLSTRAVNHWDSNEDGYWATSYWDACYPNIQPAASAHSRLDKRASQIWAYVDGYYQQAYALKGNNLILQLDALKTDGKALIEAYLGASVASTDVWLNKGGIHDSLV
ncbi:MAG: hypothetical protein V7744_19935 [Pseudomonadales bacterium]